MTHTPSGATLAPEFLTREQVASLLQLSAKTIFNLVERGALPVHRVARRLRFLRADVLAFMQSRRVAARDPRPYGRAPDQR